MMKELTFLGYLGANLSADFGPIHSRHREVDRNDVIRLGGLHEGGYDPRAVLPKICGVSQTGQKAQHDHPIVGIVLHYKQSQRNCLAISTIPDGKPGSRFTGVSPGAKTAGKAKVKVEPCPRHFARRWFPPSALPIPYRSQARAGAAVLARRRAIHLAEFYKEAIAMILANANPGVLDGKINRLSTSPGTTETRNSTRPFSVNFSALKGD